jgi:hypothetical protein
MRGETISFCATSLGRNCFLQVATGLFGGDPSWGIGTYVPTSEYYRNSSSYRATVASGDGTYQRAPVACWYAMGKATLNSITRPSSGHTVLRLTWTVPTGLWTSVRVPGQCFSFCDAGSLIHGELSNASTIVEAVVSVPPGYQPFLEVGDVVPYMIRQRAPRMVIPGPVEIGPDGDTIALQGDPNDPGFVPPAPSAHLLYLGRRSDHPAQLCAMEVDPEAARTMIFSVDDVSFQASTGAQPMYALQSRALTTQSQSWSQLTFWLAVGCISVSDGHILTGIHYDWPYPKDQNGQVWMVVPKQATTGVAPPCPGAVYMVRAACASTPVGPLVDNVALRTGDRIFQQTPPAILEWSATQTYRTVFNALPPFVLCIVEAGGLEFGLSAWWSQDGTVFHPYQATVVTAHPRGKTAASVAIQQSWELPSSHAFVVMTRRADGLYAASVGATQSNIGRVPSGWTWTYPLSTTDGADRFDGASATDGLLGLPRSLNPSRDVDYACLRRRLGSRPTTDPRPPEHLRLNVDMGGAVVLKAFAWAVVMDRSYPTITVHGSNEPAFFADQSVDIPMQDRTPAGSYSKNVHLLQHGTLLWRLCVDQPGSAWTAEELQAGTADIYLTRLSSDPRYTRLYSDGRIAGDSTSWGNNAHAYPSVTITFDAYRYYAFTLSVGTLSSAVPHTVEIQEFQPLVEAPAAATTVQANLFGRGRLPSGTGKYTVKLNRPVPVAERGRIALGIGYIEVWDSFKVRAAYHQGQVWSVSSFPTQPGMTPGRTRQASVSLSEVVLPRGVIIRSINAPITSVPYLWCFVRHRAIQPLGDQSTIVNRMVDADRVLSTYLQPPSWTSGRDTIWFQLTIPSARIPGDSQYIGLSASNMVPVVVTDSVGSALPEFCLVLPSGEVLDIAQYGDNIHTPDEVQQDEWASVNVMLTIQFDEPAPKPRTMVPVYKQKTPKRLRRLS